MKRLLGYGTGLASTTLLAIAAQPVLATTMITGIQVIPTDTGAQIVLQTADGGTPQVFAVNQGNTLRADIVRTQLELPEGDRFVQQDPAPGIAAIALTPLDGNSVRLTVDGSGRIPTGTVGTSSNGGIIIDVATQSAGAAAPQANTPVPADIETVPSDEPPLIPPEQPATVAQAVDDPDSADGEASVDPAAPAPDVLVPNPQVVIDGVPVQAPSVQQAPPFLPAAVAPPVGDIAVAESVPTFGFIDLGTTERVPRLVLRDAPSREVLNLLARAADLNLVFIDADGEATDESGGGEGPPITLDIENESVQDVFNSVLRVTGLEANRVGRTIYVSPNLPDSARNLVSRTFRLNQVDASTAAGYLASLGAEATQIVTVRTFTQIGEELGAAGGDGELTSELQLVEESTETEVRPLTLEVDEESAAARILRGLLVTVDERTNALTLIGEPEAVARATEYLAILDIRRRQVAVNVKVIDVDLNALDAFGTSFSFTLGDASFLGTGGLGLINFGSNSPTVGPTGVPNSSPITPSFSSSPGGVFDGGGNFLFQLFATVEEGNSKILTDPTLIVQEGQTASVALTEQIVARITESVTDIGDSAVVTREPELAEAGLALTIAVDRIDDNGFISLNVSPSLSSPIQTVDTGGDTFVTLLSNRELSSGQIRVRDGQTLVLSGIIQESDRTSITKVPILGDLPLLGALFRSTVRDSDRNELIVLLTPRILDDSDQSTFGYTYTPSEEVQEILERTQQR